MDLKKETEMRLELMIQAGMISERTRAFCMKAAQLLLEEQKHCDGDKLNMLITHLAMAADRMEKDNAEENAVAAEIFEEVRREECFQRAVSLVDRILKDAPAPFTGTERDFITIHLCNLLM